MDKIIPPIINNFDEHIFKTTLTVCSRGYLEIVKYLIIIGTNNPYFQCGLALVDTSFNCYSNFKKYCVEYSNIFLLLWEIF